MAETLLKIVDGQVYGWNEGDGMSGLGEGKWDWIAPVGTAVGGAVAAWVAGKASKNQPYPSGGYPPGGVQLGATSSGLFGGIDTTTLLLIGGAALLFMSMPASKK
jgi:hypothetical protein